MLIRGEHALSSVKCNAHCGEAGALLTASYQFIIILHKIFTIRKRANCKLHVGVVGFDVPHNLPLIN